MFFYNNIKETQKLTGASKSEESCGCENRDWLWGNGKSYCPYCGNPIKA